MEPQLKSRGAYLHASRPRLLKRSRSERSPLVYFGGRGPKSSQAVRTDRVVRPSPAFKVDLRLQQRVDLRVAQLDVEALAEAVSPRTARFDEQRSHNDASERMADLCLLEFQIVNAARKRRHAAADSRERPKILEYLNALVRPEFSCPMAPRCLAPNTDSQRRSQARGSMELRACLTPDCRAN